MSPTDGREPAGVPPAGLDALEARLRDDLEWLEWPRKTWVAPRRLDGQDLIDVAIIGAGMAGMTVAAALMRLGVQATSFDRSPEGFEGPWATTARMETLRSPKQLTGPALGLPALTFRAWYQAQFGPAAWGVLDKIPRLLWMDYLRWYRRVLGLDVRNRHAVVALTPRPDGAVALTVDTPSGTVRQLARRVVLATGRDGLGSAWVPPCAHALPRDRWAHSSDDMDYARLAGRRVGVVGAGASAMDSAATALEAGAASVELLIRRRDLPRINKGKGAGNPGFVHGFRDLPDDWKWRIRHYIGSAQTPPPHGSTLRVSRFANARFNLGCTIESIVPAGDALRLATSVGRFELDFLIFSTGFQIDWTARPEFAGFAGQVLAWKDRFTPPADQQDREMLDSPYLGPTLELLEKTPGSCPGLDRIHCFCYPATMSHGTVSGDIPAITDGAERLARGLASRLYREDVDWHFGNIQAFDEPELFGDEWTPADAPPDA